MAAVEIVFTTEDTEESFSKTSVILCVLCGESLSLLLLLMPFSRALIPTSSDVYGVYLKLLMYMNRVGPMVAVPPQLDLLVPHALNRNGAAALGTA